MPMQKNLFKLSWPIYIELLFFMLMGIADTLMLSQYSDLAVASVGNANRIVGLFTVLLNVVAIGVGVVVSQYIGAGEKKEAKSAIKAGIYSNFLIGIIIFLVLQTLGSLIFRIINVDASIVSDSLLYLRIVSFGLLFLSITQATSSGFKSFGMTKTIMVVVGATNVLNVILNFFLIFGIGPFPELGVRGAAISTTFSKGIMVIVALTLLYKRLGVHPFFVHFRPLRVHFTKIIKIGLPSAAEHFTYQFTQVIILGFVNTIGVAAVTTQIYVQNLTMPVLVFALAVAQGNQVIVGWHVGAREYDDAYKRTLRSLKIAVAGVVVIVLVMYFNASHLLRFFTDDETIISMGQRVMTVVIFLEMGRLSNLVVIQSLRATGDVIFPVVIGIMSMFGVSVVLSYVLGLHFGLGLIGIYIGFAADEITRGTLVFIRWLRKDWIGKRVIEKHI